MSAKSNDPVGYENEVSDVIDFDLDSAVSVASTPEGGGE